MFDQYDFLFGSVLKGEGGGRDAGGGEGFAQPQWSVLREGGEVV